MEKYYKDLAFKFVPQKDDRLVNLTEESKSDDEINGLLKCIGGSVSSYQDGKKFRAVLKCITGNGTEIDMTKFDVKESFDCEKYVNKVVAILGKLNEWNNNLSIIFSEATVKKNQEELLKLFEEDISPWIRAFKWLIEQISDDEIREVCKMSANENWQLFSTKEAALSMHDSSKHGLLKHTVKMMFHSRYLASFYRADISTCIAGTYFHDFGKIDEIDKENNEYTPMGKLFGHAVLGRDKFVEYAKKCGLDEKKRIAIEHCILSHSGELEFGAPIKPATKEAFIVNLCDTIDSKMGGFIDFFDELKGEGYAKNTRRHLLDINKKL